MNESSKQSKGIRKRTLAIVALVTIGALGVSFAGNAMGRHDGHGFAHIEKRMERIMDRLDVDDTQRAAIRSIVDQRRNEFRAYHDRMKAARRLLHETGPDAPDYDRVTRQAAEEIGSVTRDGIVAMTEVRREIWAELTPPQREKAEKMMRRFHKHRGQRSGHDRGHGDERMHPERGGPR